MNAVTKLLKDLSTKVPSEKIKAIGIDGLYGGSGIPVDEKGNAVGSALIWMDRRAKQQTDEVNNLVSSDELMKITGNLADPYYGYTKIMWIKENQANIYKKTKKFLPPESYVIEKLTGNESINYSAAGNLAGIFNINSKKWSPELAKKLGIDLNKLPQKMISSTEVAGTLKPEVAQRLNYLKTFLFLILELMSDLQR